MKNIRKILLGCLALSLFACSEDAKMTVDPTMETAVPPVLNAVSQTPFVLDKNHPTDTAVIFTWNQADFGYPAAANYVLEVALPGTNFVNAVEMFTAHLSSSVVTVEQMNKPIAGALECPPGVVTTVEARLKTTIYPNFPAIYSNVISFKVNPYPTYGILYVPGDYQNDYACGGNWNPGCPATRIFSPKNDDKYEGYLYLVNIGGGFKFSTTPAWDGNDYGAAATDGQLEHPGGNISFAGGYYKLNVDMKTLAYTKTLITTWGIIGSATAGSWDNSTPMTYDVATHTWKLTTNLTPGEMKFRANDGWDLNYGGTPEKLVAGGDNIAISEAGNYTIVLTLSQPDKPGYFCTITKN